MIPTRSRCEARQRIGLRVVRRHLQLGQPPIHPLREIVAYYASTFPVVEIDATY